MADDEVCQKFYLKHDQFNGLVGGGGGFIGAVHQSGEGYGSVGQFGGGYYPAGTPLPQAGGNYGVANPSYGWNVPTQQTSPYYGIESGYSPAVSTPPYPQEYGSGNQYSPGGYPHLDYSDMGSGYMPHNAPGNTYPPGGYVQENFMQNQESFGSGYGYKRSDDGQYRSSYNEGNEEQRRYGDDELSFSKRGIGKMIGTIFGNKDGNKNDGGYGKGGWDGGGGYDGGYRGGGASDDSHKHGGFRDGIGDFIGGFMGGGGKSGGTGGGGSGGGINMGDIAGIIGGLAGGGSKKDKIGGLISGIGGLINKNKRFGGGGPNVKPDNLKGGMIDLVGNVVGHLAHRFLGVDPSTGKIIGAIAGNVIFNMGGKDNRLGNIGKIVLDNIVSGKFKRKVDRFVPPEPSNLPQPPSPYRQAEALDFYNERDRCLAEQCLFEDPEFPADDSSLFFSRRPPKRIEWKRPAEIVSDPQLIYEGQSRFDVIQGELGDCWLLAAAANLTLRDELFYRVVPPDQSFTENYAGIFHFQFWHYGNWVDVVIDDRLPTADGELLYMHSRDHNEFWSALLEKAYAKLHGSYEALKGGTTSEALEDMTGGLTEFLDLKQPPNHLMEMMMRGFEMGSLFGCSIEADPYVWEARMSNGLVRGHAYSITGMRIVNGPYGKTPILRIRNPWGNQQEWNGAWSDGSREWNSISSAERQELGLVFAHDGEFWMSFNDFMRNFEKMEICNLGPDVMNEISEMTGVQTHQNTWAARQHDSAWIANETAGGCRNYIDTFADNPQFFIRLTDSDPNDDDDLCTVIIAVMQKYRRELRHTGIENLAIGFAIYEVGDSVHHLDRQFFLENRACARSAAFINLREITGRFRVPPGNYVIVPSTFEPDEEAEFMLRIYTNGFIESAQI